MKSIIKLIINEQGIRSTPSIYISIILAYLEVHNWTKAKKTVRLIENMTLTQNEQLACYYLKKLIKKHNIDQIQGLLRYLNA